MHMDNYNVCTSLDESPAHRRALFKHFGIWYLAQGCLSNAPCPGTSLLPAHLPSFVWNLCLPGLELPNININLERYTSMRWNIALLLELIRRPVFHTSIEPYQYTSSPFASAKSAKV